MKTNFTVLPPDIVKNIKGVLKPVSYFTKAEIIYQGHIPHAGFIFLEGKCNILKRKKIAGEIPKGSFFGLKELIEKKPSPYGLLINPVSQLFVLDYSTIEEILKDPNQELAKIINFIIKP